MSLFVNESFKQCRRKVYIETSVPKYDKYVRIAIRNLLVFTPHSFYRYKTIYFQIIKNMP